ncbi:MAG: hypothetical protein LBK01_05245 [Burkholderiaceae bacterium]|nr:hypothetical protein [Burkholderiaceae bacterium]
METARIKEGSLFFRGLDDRMLNSLELPNPYSDYVYVIYPGRHRLFGMNIQSGHILMPEDLRCYSMEVNLDAGVEYVIDEVKDKEEAILRRQDNGQVVARGKKYEQKDAYTGPCSMKK